MNFFFDRNIAVTIAHIISAYAVTHQIKHQDEDSRFNSTSTDVFIFMTLASENPKPILITADLYKKHGERAALKDSGLTVVFFRSGFHNQSCHIQAVKTLNIWPTIVQETTTCREPTIFEISPNAAKVQRKCRTCDITRF